MIVQKCKSAKVQKSGLLHLLRLTQVIVMLLLVLGIFACKQAAPPVDKSSPRAENDSRLKVLTTIAPLYSFTKNIAGDSVVLENLLPSGVGPHEYSLSPADVRKIADADMLIKNGIGLEVWMDKLVGSVGKKELIVVDTSEGIEDIDNDPHIWLSLRRAALQVRNIEAALIKADPANHETYIKNAGDYIERLEALDREITESVKRWENKELVTFHSAFSYFSMDYGLRHSAVLEGSPEAQPSPGHIAGLTDRIKSAGIRVIFSEPDASHKVMGSIADDLGLRVYSLDTLETGELDPGWYESKIRTNLETLNMALKTR
jgi:ABC-type Zn uptake system ZnuABC Zn-binding protein ZnuA